MVYWEGGQGGQDRRQEYLVKLGSFSRQRVRFLLLACRYPYDKGYLYEFKSNGDGYIGLVEHLYKDTVDFDLFAMELSLEWPFGSTFDYKAMIVVRVHQ